MEPIKTILNWGLSVQPNGEINGFSHSFSVHVYSQLVVNFEIGWPGPVDIEECTTEGLVYKMREAKRLGH